MSHDIKKVEPNSPNMFKRLGFGTRAIEEYAKITPDEIRKAHRDLVKLWHPDQNGGDRSHEAKLTQINEAWDTLRNDAGRTKHIQKLSRPAPPPPPPPPPHGGSYRSSQRTYSYERDYSGTHNTRGNAGANRGYGTDYDFGSSHRSHDKRKSSDNGFFDDAAKDFQDFMDEHFGNHKKNSRSTHSSKARREPPRQDYRADPFEEELRRHARQAEEWEESIRKRKSNNFSGAETSGSKMILGAAIVLAGFIAVVSMMEKGERNRRRRFANVAPLPPLNPDWQTRVSNPPEVFADQSLLR